jgi:hypothetical protein
MEQIECSEISVRNYHSSLHKISKSLRSYLNRGKIGKSRTIPWVLTGAIWVDNCPQKYRRSNCRGRWSWWPQQCQSRISNTYQSNQEIIWLCLLRMFVTVFFSNLIHFNLFPNLTHYFFKFDCNISSNWRLLPVVTKSGPSEMWRHILWYAFIGVLKEHPASIFRVEIWGNRYVQNVAIYQDTWR